MRVNYPVALLCTVMNINRSGYYKWRSRRDKPNRYEVFRDLLSKELLEVHKKHKSYGYHSLARMVRNNKKSLVFSDNLAHKCCKFQGIKSLAKHHKYKRPGSNHITYDNVVNGSFDAQRPLQIVVSDMTCIKHKNVLYEFNYILDIFNNEIIAYDLGDKWGASKPYFNSLKQLLAKADKKTPLILHTDQGSTYSSHGYQKVHKNYNIIRSMSRKATPTDNPVIESINGWIKAELRTDFDLDKIDDFYQFMDEYVYYFNHQRPAYALGYKTPVEYRTELGFT